MDSASSAKPWREADLKLSKELSLSWFSSSSIGARGREALMTRFCSPLRGRGGTRPDLVVGLAGDGFVSFEGIVPGLCRPLLGGFREDDGGGRVSPGVTLLCIRGVVGAAGFAGVACGIAFCGDGARIAAEGGAIIEVGRVLAAGNLVVGSLDGPRGMPVDGLLVAVVCESMLA